MKFGSFNAADGTGQLESFWRSFKNPQSFVKILNIAIRVNPKSIVTIEDFN